MESFTQADVYSFLLEVGLRTSVYMFYVIAFAFLVWMAVDAAKQDKFWWLVIVVGLPVLGSIVYYFVEKKKDYMTTTGHLGHVHRKEKKTTVAIDSH